MSAEASGHAVIYVGIDPDTGYHQVAETDGSKDVVGFHNITKISPLTMDALHSTLRFRNVTVYRLRPEIVNANWNGTPSRIIIQWQNMIADHDPNNIDTVTVRYDEDAPVFYSGIAAPVGPMGVEDRLNTLIKGIWNGFLDIINYAIGIPALIVRMPFVGLAHMAEDIVSATVQVISEDEADREMTLEKIIFNEVPIFDINIFDFNEAGGKALTNNTEGENVIISLRKNIAIWYAAFRNLVIAILFVILIYLGIRMAITSIAEEKAHYKKMLVDWFISFVIVMVIHYFLVIVLGLNDHIIKALKESVQSTDIGSVYEKVKELAYGSVKFTEGWYGTIMYIALIWFMVKFAWKYAKRMLTGYILIMLSPLVAISYALDKIRDNKAQSLGKWMKEIAYTILIQAVHCLIYVTFVSGIIAQIIAGESNILQVIGVTVLLVIAIKFMETAENIFKTIFGFESSSVLKEVMSSSFEMFAKFKLATKIGKAYFRSGFRLGRFTFRQMKKPARAVGNVGTKALGQLSAASYRVAPNFTQKLADYKNEKKDEINRLADSLTPPKIDYSKETTTDINKYAKMEEARFNSRTSSYAAKAKQAKELGANTVKSAFQAIHFTFDESTSIAAAISKGVAASVVGAHFIKDVVGEGVRRVVKKPSGKNGIGNERQLNGKRYFGEYGRSSYLKENSYHNKKMRLFESINKKDANFTKNLHDAMENGAMRGFNEGATEEEKRVTKSVLHVLSERLKAPSSKDTGEAVMGASGKTISQDSIYAIGSLEELYEVTKVARQKNETIPQWHKLTPKKAEFINKTKNEMQTMIIKQVMNPSSKQVMNPSSKGALTFSGEYADKFTKKEQTVRQEAAAKNLSKAATDKYVRDAVKDEVQKALSSEEGQKELMRELGTDNMAMIATKVASKENTETFTKASVKKAIEQRKEEKQIDIMIDKSIDLLEQKTGLKINRDVVKTNYKKELEDIAVNNATGEIESIRIPFGKDLDKQIEDGRKISSATAYGRKPMSDKQLEQIGLAYNLSAEQLKDLKADSRLANEQFKDVTREILHEHLNEGAEESPNSIFTNNELEILNNLSLEDQANILTRALNGEGSIERKVYSREDLNNLFFDGAHTEETERLLDQTEKLINQAVDLQRSSTDAMLKLNLSTFSVVDQIRREQKNK